MAVEAVFNKIASHIVEGIMVHDEMANAYDFLGLYGFAKCHDYHHLMETCAYRKIAHYYSTHYHKLLKIDTQVRQTIIPETWYKYSTMEVDVATKRNAVKDLMHKWVDWERATLKLYSEMRQELYNDGEVAAALELDCLICDVNDELVHAEKKLIKLETVNYDIGTIIGWQQPMYRKYKKSIKG